MVYTTLSKIYALSPNGEHWERLLNYFGKNYPSDKGVDILQIVYLLGLHSALWYCKSLPELDKHWRIYAIWCARRVRPSVYAKHTNLWMDTAEKYANGQVTQLELVQASMSMGGGPTVMAAMSTTIVDAGLAVQSSAIAAAKQIAHYAGMEARIAIPDSSDEIEMYCNANAAYDLAYREALELEKDAQLTEFVRLVNSLKLGQA